MVGGQRCPISRRSEGVKETENPEENWSMDVNISESDCIDWSNPLPVLQNDVLSILMDETENVKENATATPPAPPPSPSTSEHPQVLCATSGGFKDLQSLSGPIEKELLEANICSMLTVPINKRTPLSPILEEEERHRQPFKRLHPENGPEHALSVSEFSICSMLSPTKKQKLENRMTNTPRGHVVPESTLRSLSMNASVLAKLCRKITKYGSELQLIKENISVSCLEAECCNATIKGIVSKMNSKVNNVIRK